MREANKLVPGVSLETDPAKISERRWLASWSAADNGLNAFTGHYLFGDSYCPANSGYPQSMKANIHHPES